MQSSRQASPDEVLIPVLMRVEFYSPEHMYGFAETTDTRVFFHLGVFVAGHWPDLHLAPSPILGEEVLVEFDPSQTSGDRAPKAFSVHRVSAPTRVHGIVESFSPSSGWGFVAGQDGDKYYIHRSEVEGGRLPVQGQHVDFYRGFKRGRPRACYVQVGHLTG